MNTRDYKECAPGEFYHIYNRGNGKQNIFYNPEDYTFFISRLKSNLYPSDDDSSRIQKLPPDSFSLVAYCLMPNHYHLLIRQNKDIPTSKLISKVCTSYGKFLNKKYDKVGHLFQDHFKQVNVSNNKYLIWLSCYIHDNPKSAGLVNKPYDYKWSSFKFYMNGRGDLHCDNKVILDQFKSVDEYAKLVEESHLLIKNNKELLDDLLLD